MALDASATSTTGVTEVVFRLTGGTRKDRPIATATPTIDGWLAPRPSAGRAGRAAQCRAPSPRPAANTPTRSLPSCLAQYMAASASSTTSAAVSPPRPSRAMREG